MNNSTTEAAAKHVEVRIAEDDVREAPRDGDAVGSAATRNPLRTSDDDDDVQDDTHCDTAVAACERSDEHGSRNGADASDGLVPVRVPASETGSETSYRLGDEVLEYPALHPDMEWEEPSASTTRRMLLLLVGTVVLWPLSLIPLVCVYGWRGAWHVLGNVGIGPQWMCLREQSRTSRSTVIRLFLQHHVSTVAYLVALIAWASSSPVRVSDVSGSVSRAMVVLQLLSVAAALVSRRLSVAVLMHVQLLNKHNPSALAGQMTLRVLAPVALLGHVCVGFYSHEHVMQVASPMLVSILRRLGRRISTTPVAVVDRAAYDAAREYYRLIGLHMFPSRETLQSCRNMRVDLDVVQPACGPVRPVAIVRPQLSEYLVVDDGMPQADEHRYALCSSSAYAIHRSMTASTYMMLILSLLTLTLLLGTLSPCVPFMLRSTILQLPALGTSAHDSVAFVAIAVAELALLVAPRLSAQFFTLGGYGISGTMLRWLEAATAFKGETGRAWHGPRQADSHQPWTRGAGSAGMDDETKHQSAAAPTAQQQLAVLRHASKGCMRLDNIVAVAAATRQIATILGNLAVGGLGSTSVVLGAVVPVLTVSISIVLVIALNAAGADAATSIAGLSAAALRTAVIVPTCTALVAFVNHCFVLLWAFYLAGRVVTALKRVDDNVVAAESRLSLALGAARRDGKLQEALELLEALRSLHNLLQQRIADSGGIRFLGIIRPGALSIGGVLALMATATVLALRLMSLVGARSSLGALG